MNVLLGLALAYVLVGLFFWLVGLHAAVRRRDFRSVGDIVVYVVLGLIVACGYWPLGISFLKQDLRDIGW